MIPHSFTLSGDTNKYYLPTTTDTQRVSSLIAHRQFLADWTRWRHQVERIHAARQMRPEQGWAWLYRSDRDGRKRPNHHI